MMGLTPKQLQTLQFISAYTERRGGVSPTYDEMAAHLKLGSKSGVHRLISALEDRGYVRRYKGLTRAIEVIRKPLAVVPAATALTVANSPTAFRALSPEDIRTVVAVAAGIHANKTTGQETADFLYRIADRLVGKPRT